jgi:hypothetical protein
LNSSKQCKPKAKSKLKNCVKAFVELHNCLKNSPAYADVVPAKSLARSLNQLHPKEKSDRRKVNVNQEIDSFWQVDSPIKPGQYPLRLHHSHAISRIHLPIR